MNSIKETKLRRIENQLRADIRWTIRSGLGWRPNEGAYWDNEKQRFCSSHGCGTCAVGAHVIHNQLRLTVDEARELFAGEVLSAARNLKVAPEWLETVYFGVTENRSERREFTRDIGLYDSGYIQAKNLAYRLTDYARAYKKQHNTSKKVKP